MQYISERNRAEYEEKRAAILQVSKNEVETIFHDFFERSSFNLSDSDVGSEIEPFFYEQVKKQSTQIARACLTPGVSGKARVSKLLEGMLISFRNLNKRHEEDPRVEMLVLAFGKSTSFLEQTLYEKLREARQTQTKLIQRTNRVRAVLARQSVHSGDANGLLHRRVSNVGELRNWVNESFDFFYKKTTEDKTIAKQLLGNYQTEWQLFMATLFPSLRASMPDSKSPDEFEHKFTAFLEKVLEVNTFHKSLSIKKEAIRDRSPNGVIRDDLTLSNGLIINIKNNLRNSMRSKTGKDSITLIFTLPIQYSEILPKLRRNLTTALQSVDKFEAVEMEIGTDLKDPTLPAIYIVIPKITDDVWLEDFETTVLDLLSDAMK